MQIFVGKHDTIEFKWQVLWLMLKGKMSIREVSHFCNISSNTLVGTWLKGVDISQASGRSQPTEIIQKLKVYYSLKYPLGVESLASSTFFTQ